jgi:hypothetical protein
MKGGESRALPPFGQIDMVNRAQGRFAPRGAGTIFYRPLTMIVESDLTVSWLLERLEIR